jgi:hypothetical protein
METMGERVATLETEVKHLRHDHERVEAIALSNQKMIRWGMGAAAAVGAMLPMVAPKLMKAMGVG